jgi:hypothetical protein
MGNFLAEKIRTLLVAKLELENKDTEAVLEGVATAALALEDAADASDLLSNGDVDQEDIASGLVDLADLIDDFELTPDNQSKVDGIVNKLLKSGTAEQKAALKEVFNQTLEWGRKAKAAVEFFDELLKTDPPVEN